MGSEALGCTQIFFKDKKNELKGPYTEREVQEWYRERWFDSSFPFYFVKNEISPDDSTSSFTLDELRTRNGIGAPFILPSDSSSQATIRAQFEQKLNGLEEEIRLLSADCEDVFRLMDCIEKMEEKIKILMKAPKKKEVNSEINSDSLGFGLELDSDSDSDSEMKQFLDEIGILVADFVLNAFAVYASGEFASWDKKHMEELFTILKESSCGAVKVARNIACEQILVEKMKKEKFFCCILCKSDLFNYKQALIHFTSNEHCEKETAEVKKSGIGEIRRILDQFTKLPAVLAEKDEKNEQDRRKKYGPVKLSQTDGLRPDELFMLGFLSRYSPLLCENPGIIAPKGVLTMELETDIFTTNLKGDIGREIMAGLDAHIGTTAPTWCPYCRCKTGDRDGYYAHLISSAHLKSLAKGGQYLDIPIRFDVPTVAVNVHRRDLI